MSLDFAAAQQAALASPVFDLLLTLLAYQLGLKLYDRSRQHPLFLPVFVGLTLVIATNLLLERSFSEYRAGAEALYILLGPVTVALALPLHQRLGHIRAMALPLLICWLLTGLVVAAAAYALMHGLDASPAAQMCPKRPRPPSPFSLPTVSAAFRRWPPSL
jgi:putative effector of murein hydrolase